MPVSIREVAQNAGVSLSTVSQVLNGNDKIGIALKTQERVRIAAAELGYEPNRFARSLSRRRTDTIGLMISGLQNPFFVSLLESAESHILKAGFQTLLDAAPSHLGSFKEHLKLSSWPVDGVLMWGKGRLHDYLGTQAEKTPVVYLNGDAGHDCDNVSFDLAGGARLAAEHLIARGYKKIARIVPFEFAEGLEREVRNRAWAEVCEAAGVPLETMHLDLGAATYEAGWRAGQELASRSAKNRPDALLCFNDVVAIGLYHGLRRAGARVPEDFALTGADGIELGRFLDRPLTTVQVPVAELTRRAVELLLSRIAGDHDTPPQNILLPTTLFVGETT